MMNTQSCLMLLTLGVLCCILGCSRDSDTRDGEETPIDPRVSFERNLLPILTARCALAGCHVADGPHGLDFRTYESFIAGGEHGPAFTPGDAQNSEIVEEIVSGKMPPGGPPLNRAEIQLFIDWINDQEATHDDQTHEHEHDDDHNDEYDGD